MESNWRPVVGYEGVYEVSDAGQVKSLDRLDIRGRRVRGKLLTSRVSQGRLTVPLSWAGKRKHGTVSRLVLEAFVGPCPPGMECCHNNGDFTDNRPENLRWDTSSSNKYDLVRHGTHWAAQKSECINGHPLRPPNLMQRSRGRQCRSCNAGRAAFRKGKTGSVAQYADFFYERLRSGVEYRQGGDRRSSAVRNPRPFWED